MTVSFSPACSATSVKRARKGSPEGLPRGAGLTPRDAIPCPKQVAAGGASRLRKMRRVRAVIVAGRLPMRSVYRQPYGPYFAHFKLKPAPQTQPHILHAGDALLHAVVTGSFPRARFLEAALAA